MLNLVQITHILREIAKFDNVEDFMNSDSVNLEVEKELLTHILTNK